MSFGNQQKDAAGIPIGCVYVPNTGFVALQGSKNTNSDTSSNVSSSVVVSRAGITLYSTTLSGVNATGNSANLDVSAFTQLLIIYNITSFSGTSMIFRVRAVDAFSNLVTLANGPTENAVNGNTFSIGEGLGGQVSIGNLIVVGWVPTSATFTAQVTVYAK